MHSSMQRSPFPSPDNAVFGVVVADAIVSVRNGEATAEEAILHWQSMAGTRAIFQVRTSVPGAASGESYPSAAIAAEQEHCV